MSSKKIEEQNSKSKDASAPSAIASSSSSSNSGGSSGSGGSGGSSGSGDSDGSGGTTPELVVLPERIEEGGRVTIIVKNVASDNFEIYVEGQTANLETVPGRNHEFYWYTTNAKPGSYRIEVGSEDGGFLPWAEGIVTVYSKRTDASVTMERTSAAQEPRQVFWEGIRKHTEAIGFKHYNEFVSKIINQLDIPFHRSDFYEILKLATKIFLLFPSEIVADDVRNNVIDELKVYLAGNGNNRLPYLNRIKNNFTAALDEPAYFMDEINYRLNKYSMFELIWSYWHEEGMLVQTMNAIAIRFQNRRTSNRDPLAQLEIDPLRPLNNLLWGFIQDEHNRLTVPRRAYEYDHHYGLTLVGKAVPTLRSADSRSKFIEAFHNLLYRAAIFYREDSDTTVLADAFPLLNALQEIHLILAEGAHNQFGDLPWTARVEMLIMQWLLARQEMKEFLRGRLMIPYQEDWMGAVDAMKKLQGWTDTGVTHFHELAVTGERIILSLRYDDWMDVNLSEDTAKAWARHWRPEIQRYIHDYHAATGVDLAAEPRGSRESSARYLMPAVHLQRRLAAQSAVLGRIPMAKSAGPKRRAELEYRYGRAAALTGNLLDMHEFE